MTGGVGGLVQVDNTGADVGLKITLKRGGTSRDRGEVTGANEHCAEKRLAMGSREGKKNPGKEEKDAHFS